MSYQVLARKWRPRVFEQMAGQEHVLRALVNALNEGRLHHAYLFTGTRGVGKTTLARILAKCLNCETGISAKPCGECAACREIDEGRFIDLIEVDAASRTKVEDTRELLDNVQYAPARGRHKVYLIDEVHMLSGHSFNALLKTLEEPPPHVKFLLATTDPQRLPATILSRCLQFNLKRMPAELIQDHCGHILEQEGIAFETAALRELARAADGSMRDSLSLLDQAIAQGGGEVRLAAVREMLGAVSREHLHALARALADSDAHGVMRSVAQLAEQAADLHGVLEDLISLLHQVALIQVVPEAATVEEDEDSVIKALADRLSPQDVQLYYQIALIGHRDLPLAPHPRSGLEMVLLRMLSFNPRIVKLDAGQAAAPAAASQTSPQPKQSGVSATSFAEDQDWFALVQAMALKGLALGLASHCSLKSRQGREVRLVLDRRHADLRTKNAEQRLHRALCERLGEDIKLCIELAEHETETPAQAALRNQAERQRAAEQAIEADVFVQALKDNFGAEVVPGSVKPVSD